MSLVQNEYAVSTGGGFLADRPIEAYVPGLRVSHRGCMLPEIRVRAPGTESCMQIIVAQKQCVIRLAAIEICLILQKPARDFSKTG